MCVCHDVTALFISGPSDALVKMSSSDSRLRPSHQGIHMSVFSPPPALHPYHDLPLGWQQSSALLGSVQGLSADSVTSWKAERVTSFVATLTGSDKCAEVFKQHVRVNTVALHEHLSRNL